MVSDFYNHCVKVFDAGGEFKYSFGSNGIGPGQFNGPTGVDVDKNDNIIIADWGNCKIHVFDKYGKFLKYVNSEVNPMYGPQDLDLIEDLNLIAVADSGNHCVRLYNYF